MMWITLSRTSSKKSPIHPQFVTPGQTCARRARNCRSAQITRSSNRTSPPDVMQAPPAREGFRPATSCTPSSTETRNARSVLSCAEQPLHQPSSTAKNSLPLLSIALSREQTVDEIISINPSATANFLEQFGDELLNKYLDHLRFTQQPRCKAGWDRPCDAPAIMVRRRVV